MDRVNALLKITPDMSDEKADLVGTMIFQQKMLMRLVEKRETGLEKYSGWHRNDNFLSSQEHDSFLQSWFKKCVAERRWVDAANLAMMLELRDDVSS